MSNLAQEIKLEIDSQLSQASMVAMAVRGICGLTILSPVEVNRLELCLVEIVNNAIEHAYLNEAGHPVEVIAILRKSEISITVSDWGEAMSGGILEESGSTEIDPDQPGTWMTSGRGLHIVKKLMDKVCYSSSEGKNSLEMVKLLRTTH